MHRTRTRRGVGTRPPTDEAFFRHYFRRIDPEVAASFTAEQRRALRVMLDGRGVARHAFDAPRSLSLGRNRYYLVFLLGREKRSCAPGKARSLGGYLVSLALAVVLLVPLFALALLLRT